jgi:thioredoxin reductase
MQAFPIRVHARPRIRRSAVSVVDDRQHRGQVVGSWSCNSIWLSQVLSFTSIEALTVVIANGARYRRLDLPNLQPFEGRGMWYWASRRVRFRRCAVGTGKRVGTAIGEEGPFVGGLHTALASEGTLAA